MAALRIRAYGESCLREQSVPVREINDEVRRLIHDMADTMYAAKGVGLAASQIGVNARLFVSDTDYVRDENGDTANRHLKVFVNPEITWESPEDESLAEGCLSVPGIEGEVYRSVSVKLRYLDENGAEHERLVEGMEARCVQHEIDHVNGVLFIDRLPILRRRLLAGKLNSLKRNLASSAK